MQDKFVAIDIERDIKSKKYQFFVKRFLDVILSAVGIVLFSPIFLIIVLAIKRDSKGPAVFKQVRIGKDGVPFTIYKFRTMIINADKKRDLQIDCDKIDKFIFQSKNDDRITRVGAFLRQTSLDEIPQLFNVFIGNMSLVGPRPEIPEVVEHYPEKYRERLLVLPGITGLAQISGRGEIELGETVYYDLKYIREYSVLMDIKIIFKTIIAVLKSEGAY